MEIAMKVYLSKDIANVGKAGTIVNASDGFVTNFIVPKKMGIIVTEGNRAMLEAKIKSFEQQKKEIAVKTSALSEKIAALTLTIAKKMHEDGKLYGALNAQDIVDLLAQKGVVIAKNQVIFDRPIKTKGSHTVTIKLSSTLQSLCSVRVVSLEE